MDARPFLSLLKLTLDIFTTCPPTAPPGAVIKSKSSWKHISLLNFMFFFVFLSWPCSPSRSRREEPGEGSSRLPGAGDHAAPAAHRRQRGAPHPGRYHPEAVWEPPPHLWPAHTGEHLRGGTVRAQLAFWAWELDDQQKKQTVWCILMLR